MTKLQKTVNISDIAFKLLFLTVGFLQNCGFTFGQKIISYVQWPTVALGAALILYRLFFFRRYVGNKNIWLLIAFSVSYVISSVLNFKYGYYENIRGFIFLVFEFGLLFSFDCNTGKDNIIKQTKICTVFFIAGTAVLSLISFILMFCGYLKIIVPNEGPTIVIGFTWGRLFGAYWDPNIAAAMASLSALISIYFLRHKNLATRIALSFNILLQIAYVIFSDSRTGKVTLLISFAVLTLIYLLVSEKRFILGSRVFTVILCTVLVAASAAVVPKTVRKAYNGAINYIALKYDTTEEAGGGKNFINAEIGREADIESDVSNRRFDIWKSSVEIFKTKPVFGVSKFNIIQYAEQNMPDTYIVNNSHMKFDSMHNIFFDILVSQGIVGVILFVLAALVIFIRMIKNYAVYKSSRHKTFFCFLFSIVVTTVCISAFITEIVYVISPLTQLFWIALGCMNAFIEGKEVKNEQ